MKNIFGTQDDMTLYHRNGEMAYWFFSSPYKQDNLIFFMMTYDDKGNMTYHKNSNGYSFKRVYKKDGSYEEIDL